MMLRRRSYSHIEPRWRYLSISGKCVSNDHSTQDVRYAVEDDFPAIETLTITAGGVYPSRRRNRLVKALVGNVSAKGKGL